MNTNINIKSILGNAYVKKLVRETFDYIVKKKRLNDFSKNFSQNVNEAVKENKTQSPEEIQTKAVIVTVVEVKEPSVEEKKAAETAAAVITEAGEAVEAVEAFKVEAKAEAAKNAILSELKTGNTIIFNSFVKSIPGDITKPPSIDTNIKLLKQIKDLIANDIEINKELKELENLPNDADKKRIGDIGNVLTKHQELILTEQKKPKNLNNLLKLIKKKMEQLNKIMKKKNNIQTGGSNMKQQLLTDLHYITKYLKYKTKYIVFKSNN